MKDLSVRGGRSRISRFLASPHHLLDLIADGVDVPIGDQALAGLTASNAL